MKQWTKKFLNLPTKEKVNPDINAKKAKEELDIPKQLWNKLSEQFSTSYLRDSLLLADEFEYIIKINTAFMAGFAVGWAEKSKDVK